MNWLRDPVFVALLNGTVGGALGYLLGRSWRRRTETCQKNCEPIFGFFGRGIGHLHECIRERGHRSRVLTHWQVTEVVPPMSGTARHWRVAPHRRVMDILDVGPAAWAELFDAVLPSLVKGQPGWGWAWRAGDPDATGGPVGVIDVVVGDPTADEVARYSMSGRIDRVTTDLLTVRATNPPSMAVRVGGYELALGASHPLLNRIDLIAVHGRYLVAVAGTPTRPEHDARRPPLPGGCEFLAYVHVPHAAAVVMDCHIETDAPVYQEDR